MLEKTHPAQIDSDRLRARYDNFIGGTWKAPVKGRYFTDKSPIDGSVLCEIARSDADDVEAALDAAHAARKGWARTSPTERARMLNKIADRIDENLELLARVETRDNGKPIRETVNADVPLSADHFRYFAACIRAEEGTLGEIDHDTVAYHFREPMGVVGQIIPWNFPLLMASWKMAPALAAGNCVVHQAGLRHADEPGRADGSDRRHPAARRAQRRVRARRGSRHAARRAAGASPRSPSPARPPPAGRSCSMRPRTIIPQTMELGGKSPNIFFADVMDHDDAFLDKALEGFALFAFNKGEVCTCPSRALVQESMFDKFMEKAVARVAKIKVGDPLDPTTQMGAQCSHGQLEKILSYIDVGKQEGAKCLTGGERVHLGGALENGFYLQPTVFSGHNKMRIFQEEIFGPVLSVTTFKDLDDAIEIGNDTIYGLGAGVWSRNVNNLLPRRPRDRGRARLDQLLPRLPGARGVRRLQAVRLRARNPQADTRSLPADQEPAGQLQPERARAVLIPRRRGGGVRAPVAAEFLP